MHELSRVRSVEKLKAKLVKEKESHASARARLVVLLAKAIKWQGEVIDKEEKLTWIANELNECARQLEASKEEEKRVLVENDAYKRELEATRCELEETIRDFEKTKRDTSVVIEKVTETIQIGYNMAMELSAVTEKVIETVQIGYNIAMESFKEEAKKKKLGKYYYKILNIPVTPIGSLTHTKMMKNPWEVKMRSRKEMKLLG